MGFEQFSPHLEEGGEKKQEKTNLYFKPFEKKGKEKKVQGIKTNEEKKEEILELENLERSLEEGEKKNEKLLKRFTEIQEKLRPNKIWTKVEVSGEKHTIAFSHLEKRNKSIDPQEVRREGEKDPNTLANIMVSFQLKKTEGRAEHLFLSLKTPLSVFLQGGGEIEKELEKLVKHQFAGTERYYSALQKKQEEQRQAPLETELFETEKAQIKGSLQKRGAEISEAQGDEKGKSIISFIASFPGVEKQIHIATVDKKSWNVAIVEDQKVKKEIFNLRPQEVLSYALEKTE